MRYTRDDNGQRRFKVDEFLTAQQTQGYFSRSSAKLRLAKAPQPVDDTSIDGNDAQTAQEEEVYLACAWCYFTAVPTHPSHSLRHAQHLQLVHDKQANQAQRCTAASHLQPLQHGRRDIKVKEKSPVHKFHSRSRWILLLY